MEKKTKSKSTLILIGIVTVILISITAVIASTLSKENRTTYEATIKTTQDAKEEIASSDHPASGTVGSSDSTPSEIPAKHVREDKPLQPGKSSNASKNSNPANKKELTDDDQRTNYGLIITRGFISGSSDDGEINVKLSINIATTPPNGLIVSEFIPKGWNLLDSSQPYKNFNSSTGEIKWLFMGGKVGTMEINYRVKKMDAISEEALFHGTYLYNNRDGEHMSKKIDGASGV